MRLSRPDYLLARKLLECMQKELSMTEMNATTKDMLLPVIFGKMSNGEIVTRDLARLPHLLIGGLAGSGKSLFLHSLICSLVQNRSPEQVRFVLMDPKRVEFGAYAKLPHLYSPIVHEPEQGVSTLKDVEAEMDKRLDFFRLKGCRSIADFYKANAEARMPYLIVVVDELSDFMVGSDGAFESTASRIAAMGRSAGVHLVIATSRPDARIASGSLKANIPGRLAFRVCQKVDSRTLLDKYGAEKLIGRGDALLKDADGMTSRLQTPYISDNAIKQVVDRDLCRPGGNCAEGETGIQEDARGDGACLFRQGDDSGTAASGKGGGMGCRPLLAHMVGRRRGAAGSSDGEFNRAAGVCRCRADAPVGCREPVAGLGDYADDR